ncbi:MAG: glycosyltransferase family 2 protein [Bacteroidota bacterium]|jgi:glycosyltransferase involved in cell wall biosynthesis
MTPISAIIITKNEGDNIEECLKSISWADDIIVVDAESKDDTVVKAKAITPNVFVQPWLGFAQAKQFGVSKAKHDWILWLDADERVPADLGSEIRERVSTDPPEAAFAVARRAYFLGRWIKHSGWYPGYVPRLFHCKRANFNSAAVHEGLEINGAIGRLRHDLLHYTDPTIYHYIAKLNRYTTLAGEDLRQKEKIPSVSDLLLRPLWQFLKMYLFRLGFLDGMQGLILALFSSAYVFTKYCKLMEKTLLSKQ